MPPNEAFTRRVCAVLLADVTGYSKLMGQDDERAANAVRHLHAVAQEIVAAAGGQAEPVAGDALFATFDSVVSAVSAALQIQERVAQEEFAGTRLQIRIGVHLGDVLVSEGRAFGDAINIAARLQSLAAPGTVCISEGVYRQVRNRFDHRFVNLGKRRLKNISDRMQAYLILPRSGEVAGVRTQPPSALVWGGVAAALVLAALVFALRQNRVPLASVPSRDVSPVSAPAKPTAGDVKPDTAERVALGVMVFKSHGIDPADDWQREALRDSLNAQLSRLSSVKVYSKEFIDFLITRQGLSEVEAATKLGISKMLSGSVRRVDGALHVETHVVDVATGVLESSYVTDAHDRSFADLQSELTLGVIAHLNLPVTPEEREVLLARRQTDGDALRLLLEAERADAPPGPSGHRGTRRWRAGLLVGTAHASDDADQEAVRGLLEQYRRATESRQIEAVAALFRDLSSEQQAAQQRYFDNVRDLKVVFENIDVAVIGDEAVVSYTRTDDFVDAKTGRPMHASVRLTKILQRNEEGWRLLAK